MVLVCEVTLQDYVVKGSSDLMGRCYSRQVSILASFVAIGTVIVKI